MLDTIKNFILDNWQLIVAVIIFVLSFILQLIKKKPVVDAWHFIYQLLPQAINEAEKSNLKGEDKLFYALRILIDLCENAYGIKICRNDYSQLLVAIEDILSTPQKKAK